jgi:hypothetical protein
LKSDERTISLSPQDETWREAAKLDGCYCLKSDLSAEKASKETVHPTFRILRRGTSGFSGGHIVV